MGTQQALVPGHGNHVCVQGVQAYIQHTRGLRRIHQERHAVLLTNGAQTAYGLGSRRHVAGMAKDYQGCPGPDGTLKRMRLQDAHGVGREDTQGNLPRGGQVVQGAHDGVVLAVGANHLVTLMQRAQNARFSASVQLGVKITCSEDSAPSS